MAEKSNNKWHDPTFTRNYYAQKLREWRKKNPQRDAENQLRYMTKKLERLKAAQESGEESEGGKE